jgi:hypothetical protein
VGTLQGGANVLNEAQNMLLGIPNAIIAAHDYLTGDTWQQLGSQWSQNLVVPNDPGYSVSMGLAGAGLTGLSLGTSAIPGTAGYVGNAGNLVDAGTVAGDYPLTGTALARQLGQEGENAVGITGSKVGIRMPSGIMRYPDAFDKATNVLDEVKNAKALSYTQQLRDYTAFTQQNGGTFNLWVRPSTTFSGPLQQAIDDGLINIYHIPGAK